MSDTCSNSGPFTVNPTKVSDQNTRWTTLTLYLVSSVLSIMGLEITNSRISRSKVEVMLGINEEKLEVYPKDSYEASTTATAASSTGAGGGMAGLGITVSAVATRLPWRRQRSASYPISTIVACDIVDKRSPSERQVGLCREHLHLHKGRDNRNMVVPRSRDPAMPRSNLCLMLAHATYAPRG